MATAAPHEPYVTGVQKQIESLLALCTAKGKEEMLGRKQDEFTPEEEEMSGKEIFQERLEEELGQLRQALASVPAPAPAAPAPEPAGP